MTSSSAKSLRPRLLVAGAAALWGMWSLCFRTAEHASKAPLSGALETFAAWAVMLAVTLPLAIRDTRARAPGSSARTARAWLLVASLGVTDALTGMLFFSAMQKTTVAVAVLTHYLQPLLTALAAPVFLGERWRKKTFVALALALAGLFLLLDPLAAPAGDLVGAGLGALSAVTFSATLLLGKKLGDTLSTWELSAYPKPVSLAVLALAVPAGGFAALAEPKVSAILVGGSLVFGALSLVMFYRGLAKTPASQAGVLTLCEPLVAVFVGVLAWREVPGPLALLGALLVLAGAAVISVD